MKFESFWEQEEEMVEALLNDPHIVIKSKHIVPLVYEGGIGVKIYIFYEETDDELKLEKDQLEAIKPIAQRIREDPIYKELKNQKQREIYLLESYNLPKSTAETTIEYIKVMEVKGE